MDMKALEKAIKEGKLEDKMPSSKKDAYLGESKLVSPPMRGGKQKDVEIDTPELKGKLIPMSDEVPGERLPLTKPGKGRDMESLSPLRPGSKEEMEELSPSRPKNSLQKYQKGGKVSSASARADGCAQRGKTRGRIV